MRHDKDSPTLELYHIKVLVTWLKLNTAKRMIAALHVHRAIVLGKYQKTKGFLISSGGSKENIGKKRVKKELHYFKSLAFYVETAIRWKSNFFYCGKRNWSNGNFCISLTHYSSSRCHDREAECFLITFIFYLLPLRRLSVFLFPVKILCLFQQISDELWNCFKVLEDDIFRILATHFNRRCIKLFILMEGKKPCPGQEEQKPEIIFKIKSSFKIVLWKPVLQFWSWWRLIKKEALAQMSS